MTFCDTLAGIEVRVGRTESEPRNTGTQEHGWTDRRGSPNSYLDYILHFFPEVFCIFVYFSNHIR